MDAVIRYFVSSVSFIKTLAKIGIYIYQEKEEKRNSHVSSCFLIAEFMLDSSFDKR